MIIAQQILWGFCMCDASLGGYLLALTKVSKCV